MGYAARAGFGMFLTAGELLAKARAAQTTTVPIAPKPVAPPTVSVPAPLPPPPSVQPLQPAVQPILVAGPAPSPSGGGGGSVGDVGLAPAAGGTGVSALLQQPAVLIGLAILGFLALRRGGGTRRF